MVQGFTGVTEVDLALPCTYDFEVTGSRYLHSVGDGVVPLTLAVLRHRVHQGRRRGSPSQPVPWDCEASYRMPVSVWQDMIAAHYPSTSWLRLDRDVLDALADFRSEHGLTSWEETVQTLLTARDGAAS